jgi:hypothetical protein
MFRERAYKPLEGTHEIKLTHYPLSEANLTCRVKMLPRCSDLLASPTKTVVHTWSRNSSQSVASKQSIARSLLRPEVVAHMVLYGCAKSTDGVSPSYPCGIQPIRFDLWVAKYKYFGAREHTREDVQGATMCVCCSLPLTTGSSTINLLPSPVNGVLRHGATTRIELAESILWSLQNSSRHRPEMESSEQRATRAASRLL